MNANKTVSMYEAVPVVSELNKVPGFNPTKYLRQTKDGWKLDLKIKKLWFRLKYPNGRIKLSALKITDQLAIIEARVYFDKQDTQPVASFTAQRENKTTPGGLYIESAQHSAIDEALSAAGFGIQFIPAKETVAAPKAKPMTETVDEPTITSAVKTTEPISHEVVAETAAPVETVAEAAKAVEETAVVEEAATPTAVVTEEIAPASIAEEMAVEETPQSVVAETAPAATAPAVEEVTEIREEEETGAAYTKDMSVDEICALMSVEEAGNIIVSTGSCKGWTLSQVADRRPVSLKWYLTGYTGDDNILRAGARIMQGLVEMQKAS